MSDQDHDPDLHALSRDIDWPTPPNRGKYHTNVARAIALRDDFFRELSSHSKDFGVSVEVGRIGCPPLLKRPVQSKFCHTSFFDQGRLAVGQFWLHSSDFKNTVVQLLTQQGVTLPLLPPMDSDFIGCFGIGSPAQDDDYQWTHVPNRPGHDPNDFQDMIDPFETSVRGAVQRVLRIRALWETAAAFAWARAAVQIKKYLISLGITNVAVELIKHDYRRKTYTGPVHDAHLAQLWTPENGNGILDGIWQISQNTDVASAVLSIDGVCLGYKKDANPITVHVTVSPWLECLQWLPICRRVQEYVKDSLIGAGYLKQVEVRFEPGESYECANLTREEYDQHQTARRQLLQTLNTFKGLDPRQRFKERLVPGACIAPVLELRCVDDQNNFLKDSNGNYTTSANPNLGTMGGFVVGTLVGKGSKPLGLGCWHVVQTSIPGAALRSVRNTDTSETFILPDSPLEHACKHGMVDLPGEKDHNGLEPAANLEAPKRNWCSKVLKYQMTDKAIKEHDTKKPDRALRETIKHNQDFVDQNRLPVGKVIVASGQNRVRNGHCMDWALFAIDDDKRIGPNVLPPTNVWYDFLEQDDEVIFPVDLCTENDGKLFLKAPSFPKPQPHSLNHEHGPFYFIGIRGGIKRGIFSDLKTNLKATWSLTYRPADDFTRTTEWAFVTTGKDGDTNIPFRQQGDSGALVFTHNLEVIGMLRAGKTSENVYKVTYVTPIWDILEDIAEFTNKKLKVQFPNPGP